ncbi:unnamed protein product [Tuber aestivum]|uniref:Uncharacterized protein n=1 Tax=Tuber aestivum TaxID=59557 RepID=A0A292PWK5_9PEZI|nr:unnamed protein product [Tuber aestivum]
MPTQSDGSSVASSTVNATGSVPTGAGSSQTSVPEPSKFGPTGPLPPTSTGVTSAEGIGSATSHPPKISAPVQTEAGTATTTPGATTATVPSTQWFPPVLSTAPASTMVTQVVTAIPGSTMLSSATTAPSAETGIPSSYPKVVTPAGGMPPRPGNSSLVRVGFNHQLNYGFVVKNSVAVAQIFEYLPKGIAYGLDIDKVIMHHLQPLDTTKTKGYITTLAFMFVPDNLIDKLDLDRRNPNSRLFQSEEAPVRQMIDLLDPTISLRATEAELAGEGTGMPGEGSWLGGPGDDQGDASNSDGAPLGSNGSEGPVSKKSIGVGLGIVAGATVYGAAMFFVARRYRQRRNRHTRSSSIGRSVSPGSNPASGLMGGAGPIMHGARSPYGTVGVPHDKRGSRGSGRASARTQNISGPMMAENSLGWN